MDDCCHDDAGFRASSVEFSAHNRAPSHEWRPRPFAPGCGSCSGGDSSVPPTPPPTHRSVSAPTHPTTPAVSGGLLDLVRLQQHRHAHIHQRVAATTNSSHSPTPLATSPSLLYDDPSLPAPTSLALPKPEATPKTPNTTLGAARTLNFISVPGVTEGVDICGDGVLGREGGLSPYYHLLGGHSQGHAKPAHAPATNNPAAANGGLEGRGLVRLRSAPASVPAQSTPLRAAAVSAGGGAAAVLGTPPRKGRVSSLSGPEAYGASDVMIHAFGDQDTDGPNPLPHPSMQHQQLQH